jgi:hypothetical protein
MGSQVAKNLGYKAAWGFIGIKGMKRSGEDTGVTVEFGTALSYTKTVVKRKEIQKVEGGSKIQAVSAGFTSGNLARIIINDADVLEKADRGINLIVLAGKNHEIIMSNTYDTHGSKKQSDQLAEDLATVPMGSVIIAAVKDEAQRSMTQNLRDAFSNLGSKEINNLKYRDAWFFIGIKGTKSHLEKRDATVNGGLILGYSKVTKTKKTTETKTINQSKSYKRTITRVVKKKETTVDANGNKTTRTVTRVQKRVVTCRRSRKIVKTKKSSTTTVN